MIEPLMQVVLSVFGQIGRTALDDPGEGQAAAPGSLRPILLSSGSRLCGVPGGQVLGEFRVRLSEYAQPAHAGRRKPVDQMVHVLVVVRCGHGPSL
jgi:hypothetical protein